MNDYDRAKFIMFINNIFSYFNGKVNIAIPARLMINTNFITKEPIIAQHYSPNVIEFFVRNFEYHTDINNINKELDSAVSAIIHELCHVEQYIDFNLIENDSYRMGIELANTKQEMTFIENNKQEINDIIRFYWGPYYIPNPVKYPKMKSDIQYVRKNMRDHILLMVSYMYGEDITIHKNLLNIIIGNDKDNVSFLVDLNHIDLNGFNNFTYFYFGIKHRKEYRAVYTIYDTHDELYIKNPIFKNQMCNRTGLKPY